MATDAVADSVAASGELRDNDLKPYSKVPSDLKIDHTPTSKSNAEEGEHRYLAHDTKDDPATMAASEELKHTTISDNVAAVEHGETSDEVQADDSAETKHDITAERQPTPGTDSGKDVEGESIPKVASPKKKRGREQEEENEEVQGEDRNEDGSSTDGYGTSRTTRSAPEKKRHRDDSEEPAIITEKNEKTIHPFQATTLIDKKTAKESESIAKATDEAGNKIPETSSAAFAKSGFASIAKSEASPFGTVGASKPSVFGAGDGSSTFGSLTGSSTSGNFKVLPTDRSTSTFGGGVAASKSSFGGALGGASPFASGLSNGFAGGSAFKLSSFAAPVKENESAGKKPEKPFGAPDSDDDESPDDIEGQTEVGSESGNEAGSKTDDKKKIRLTKVPIDDGEADEITLLQIRAKLFNLHSKESGWKERGVGTLKVNVHRDTMDFWPNGQFAPDSFDPSGMKSEDTPIARLVMRQENTHRVILNTIIYKALDFKDKPSASGAQMIFTIMEGDADPKPVQLLLKMNEANGKIFRQELEMIKRELP